MLSELRWSVRLGSVKHFDFNWRLEMYVAVSTVFRFRVFWVEFS